jgi:RNA polymerase sigma factor (sigma-70 family)
MRQPIVDQIPALRRYARVLTGDTWAADDLVQDTLERACNKWRLWVVGTDLRAWLFTMMHNLFINQLRRSASAVQAGALNIDDLAQDLTAPDAGLAQSIDLQRCLLRLPQDQRAVLLLVCLEDMGYREVAQITGVPIGTVMSRLSRARARLQELLDAPALKADPTQSADAATSLTTPDGRVLPLRRLK